MFLGPRTPLTLCHRKIPDSRGSKTEYVAYERLLNYSIVFIIDDHGIFKVYSSQRLDILDNDYPFFVGIVQSNACPGDIVEVVESGLTRVMLSTTLTDVSNRDLYIAKSDDVTYATCANDPVDTRYVRRGFYLYLGRIPAIAPGTPPVSTTFPVCYISFSLVPVV